MKTRKFSFFTVLLLSVCVAACDSGNGEDDPPANQNIRLTKEIVNETDYGTSTYLYLYDTQNRLRKIASEWTDEFFYNTDGTLSHVTYSGSSSTQTENYFYKNGKIDFIERIGFNKNTNHDTIYFFYGSNGRLDRTESSYYSDGIVRKNIVEYTFDNNNRLLSRFERSLYDNELIRYDSTYYSWSTSGNLNRVDIRQWSEGLVNYVNKIEYEYDNKLNFYKTISYPAEYLLVKSLRPDEEFSLNNYVVQTRTNITGSSNTYIHNISSYNEQGYPLMINADWGTWELEYETY
ncbi:MAG: hypothetical protein FD166_3148 [Bacteroidetes bacterium]|nr:MAG: hypothetical protein FD166_3148 [Bacteroidota bacterium]